MTHLIPEKRMDRHGRVVTRYVRPASSGSGTAFPAPALATEWPSPSTSQNSLTLRVHIMGQFSPDGELRQLVKKQRGDIEFRASDAQIYEVLSVAAPGDALLLLNEGVRTSDGALSILHAKNLGRLVADNERWCMEAMKRSIPAQSFMESLYYGDKNATYFMDAAEASGFDGMELQKQVPDAVLAGTLSIDDLRTVGSHRFKMHSGWSGRIAGKQLIKIAEGEGGKCTPSSLATLMDDFGAAPTTLNTAIALEERYGAQLTSQLSYVTDFLLEVEEYFRKQGTPDEDIIWTLAFASEVGRNSSSTTRISEMSPQVLQRFRKAGFLPQDVGSGKVTVSHLEAVETGDLKKTVADGWL